ncbi:MAG TPA: hypothetical protein VME40_13660 [Caulobacteraceae bacterium]|nr:hypothetical protein [Caulobacteraceae bacterium]
MQDAAATTLLMFITSFVLGGVIIGVVVLQGLWRQVILALLLSLFGFLWLHSTSGVSPVLGTLFGDFFGFSAVGLATLALARLLFSWLKGLRSAIARRLSPQLWPPQPAEALSTQDGVKRWFVTIAAATGSLVGMLMSDLGALKVFLEAFAIQRLLETVLITIASVILIGPVEEYVYGVGVEATADHGQGSGLHSHPLERVIAQMSWRAFGRLAMVGAAVMLLNIVHLCIEETMRGGDTETALSMLLTIADAAVVTYFWSAALQRGTFSVARRASTSTIWTMTLLYFPGMAIMATATFGSEFLRLPGYPSALLWLFFIFFCAVLWIALLLAAVVIAVVHDGAAAFFGGLVLNSRRVRPNASPLATIAFLVLALIPWQAASALLAALLVQANDAGAIFVGTVLSLIGWGVGLYVSGFPDILKRAPPPAPASAPAS